METATLVFYFSSCIFLYFLVTLVNFFNKVWFKPLHLQSMLNSQGLKGPSYQFLYGNTREILSMSARVLSSPMELSNHIFPRIHPQVYSWTKIYGMNVLNWYGPQPQIIVTEPDLIKEVMNNKDGGYPKATEIQTHAKKLLGNGLVTLEGEKWSKMRKLSNHAFFGESLKGMIPAMIASTEMMLERWNQDSGRELDVFPEFKILTSEVISRTAFGSSYMEGQHIFDLLVNLANVISRNYYKIIFPVIGKFVKPADEIESDKLLQQIRDSIIQIVKKREDEALLDGADNYGSDFLGLLMKAYHDGDEAKKISVDELIDECRTFYVAGQETTASSLCWTLLLLATHQDWQDRVRDEVVELMGQQHPTADNISRLKTMSMVIHESLRLYPPVVYVMRKAEREMRLGNLTVPAGMEFLISIIAMHHKPEIWGEDFHVFKPERFADGVANATDSNTAAFCPFGLGPRTCAGFNFALTEMKIVFSMILRKYRFTLSPTYAHSPVQLLAMQPQHGLQVILHPL